MDITPRLSTVIARASVHAADAGLDVLGVEHVFLGILDEEDSIPTQMMTRLGLVDQLRTELRTILESEGYRNPGRPSPSP